MEAQPEPGLRLAVALGTYWQVRGPWSEARSWLARLLAAAPTAPPALRARALTAGGWMASKQGDVAGAHAAIGPALALFRAGGDPRGMAEALRGLSILALMSGGNARVLQEESLELAQAAGDTPGMAAAVYQMGHTAWREGEVAAARAHYEQSLALAQVAGDQRAIALALHRLGTLTYEQRDYTTARAMCQASVTLFEALGAQEGIAMVHINLGAIAQELGDLRGVDRTL